MPPNFKQRGVTLFESLVTILLLFVVLSSVVTLLDSSLRALKNQRGRAVAELAFVQEVIRRDLADALTVAGGDGQLELTRSNYTVPWQELLERKTSPRAERPVRVAYELLDGSLRRISPVAAQGETLLSLEGFFSQVRESDVRVGMSLTTGQRKRELVWSFRCPAL